MLKIALVGLGVMGRNHYRVLSALPDAEVVGLCDNQVEAFEGQKVWPDLEPMLEAVNPDAVVIATPTFLHHDMALLCAKKGVKRLFIEKPVAASEAEAQSLLEQLPADTLVAVGHVERFNPVITALKKELADKEVYSLAITRVGPFPPRIADVGILTDLAVHDVDLIRFITGKEVVGSHIFASKKIHNHHEDNAVLSFELESHVIATITTNWLTPYKKRKIEVATPEGYFEADLMSQELRVFSSYSANHSYLVRDVIVYKGEPLKNELSAFIQWCKSGERSSDLASIGDSLKTLSLVARQPDNAIG
jgi:predicted dehydrogenase